MTGYALVRRLVYAFLFAVLLAVALGIANDLHASEVIIYAPKGPSICDSLEPYGWWWFFWNCGAA